MLAIRSPKIYIPLIVRIVQNFYISYIRTPFCVMKKKFIWKQNREGNFKRNRSARVA